MTTKPGLPDTFAASSNRCDYHGRRVLVTGGLGFLGSHLVRELLDRGAEVVILDDRSNCHDASLSEFTDRRGVLLHFGSTGDAAAVAEASRGVFAIFHLAAMVGVARVAADPARVLDQNLTGARRVVEAAERTGARLLFVSSSEVYGSNAPGGVFKETDAPGFCMDRVPFDGRAAYACSKWQGELRVRDAIQRGLFGIIARPFNTVGPGQSLASGAAVPTLLDAALSGRPLQLLGDGTSTRSYALVTEVVRALANLIVHDAAAGETVNVGGGSICTIRSLAGQILRITGSSSPIIYQERLAGPPICEIRHRLGDFTKLRRLAGFVPSTPVARAVKATLAWKTRVVAPA